MRAGRAAGRPTAPIGWPWRTWSPTLHVDPRQMQERAVQAHAVVDHQQIALQREGLIGGQDDDAVGGGGDDACRSARAMSTPE